MTVSAPIVAAAMAPDWSWAVTVADDGTVRAWDAGLKSWVNRGTVPIGAQPVTVAMSGSRRVRVLWAAEETLSMYEEIQGVWSRNDVARTSAPVRALAVSRSGGVAVIACEDGTLRSLNVLTGTFGWTLATGGLTARAVAVASDRGPVVAVFPDGIVRRYDPEAGTSDIVGTAPSASLVTITPEGGVVVAAGPHGLVSRWRPPLGARPELRRLGAVTTAVAVDGTGDKVLVGRDDGRVWFYDFAGPREGGAARYPSFPMGAFEPRPSPTGERSIVDEDVRFTVYRPQVMSPGVWAPLLVFAHKTDLVQEPGQPPVDPNEQVEARARAHFGDAVTRPAAADAQSGIFRGARLRIVPDLPGVRCKPEDAELGWWDPVHEVLFRLRAEAGLAGSVVRGAVRVWCGPLLLGEVSLAISIAASGSSAASPPVADSVQRYRKIFASYSHDDRAVVAGFAEAARALGDQYLQDVLALRAGERWEARLLEFIGQADVFQLFWSSNSMRSRNCREEWEHALALRRPSFVRPLYWEDPLPEDPAMGLPPVGLRELHFVKVRPYSAQIVSPPGPSRASEAPSFGGPAPAPPPDSRRSTGPWRYTGGQGAGNPPRTTSPGRSRGTPGPRPGAPVPQASGRAARRTPLVAAVLVLLVIAVVAVLVVLHVLG